jgi:DNA-binding CsgD family transcriptional regulator/tetratricopeptide (TPR) repeat protein
VLLEREAQLDALVGAVEDAVRGRGSSVLVAGEAGIGKTSLVRELRTRVEDRASCLFGACEPLSVPAPLQPLREMLEAAGAEDPATLGSSDHLVLARSVLGALADRAPVVAVVEDAHWADPLTLDLLRILSRRVEQVGVVLAVTYRDEEVAANPALALLLGDLASSPTVRRIVLPALSGAAVRELAAGSGVDGASLLGATGGNPFLVVEAIAAGGGLPASVRDAALARAGRLSLAARQVVDVAAVIGRRFEPALLHSLVGECADAVEESLARGVLVADGGVLGFRHELIRGALEQSISPLRRADLHARVFSALVEQPHAADRARLAHHAELGGLDDEAARCAVDAAAEAERVGALRETYLQADRALRLGHTLTREQRFELLVQYSRAANFANPRLEDAVDAAQQALAVAEQLADDGRRGRASMVLAYALWSLERVVDARAAAERAIRAFEPTEDVASLAWAHAALLRMDATSFDPASAIEMAPAALALAEAAGLEEARIDVSISVGLARGHRGEPQALAVLGEALAAARRGGFMIRAVRACVNLMTVAVALRAHERVDEIAAEALPLFEERGVSALPTMAIRAFRARSLMDRGLWHEALAVAALRERWWQGEYPVAGAMEGLIRVRRGEDGGTQLLETARVELAELVAAESSRHGMMRLALVESAWLRDEHAAALAQLTAARDSPAVARFARPAGELALWGQRFGVEWEPPPGAPLPVRLELEGDWRGAIEAWHELQAPYEAALAALPGDQRAARAAVAGLHRLGASAAARAFTRERTARGSRAARGPRPSTLANPAGLTRREQEVLEAIATGASNAAIALALHLSERTVAHHVSAILGKLGVPNRHLAVTRARDRGLLSGAQDGNARAPS